MQRTSPRNSNDSVLAAVEKWLSASDIETERTVLRGLICSSRHVEEILATAVDEDFTVPEHIEILRVARRLYAESKAITLATVSAAAGNNRAAVAKLFDKNGADYLPVHLKDLLALSQQRNAARIYCDGLRDLKSSNNLSESIAKSINSLATVTEQKSVSAKSDLIPIDKVLTESISAIENIWNKRKEDSEALAGIPTGFKEFDQQSSGMHPGELVIIAARPGLGKTAMMAQIAIAAAERGFGSIFCSAEMPSKHIGLRILASETVIPNFHLRRGEVTETEIDQLFDAQEKLGKLPIVFLESESWEVIKIKIIAAKNADPNLSLAVVDHLQLLRSERIEGEQRYQALGRISREMKKLAIQLGIVVLLACQISRASEEGNRKPRLSDLRESGDIEQNADVVSFIWQHNDKSPEDVVWFIEKNRSGPKGSAYLKFDGNLTKFFEKEEGRRGLSWLIG